jgi:hypothetical protein
LDVADFVDLAISKIPTSFGKLTLLAGLRDANTGHYTDTLAALVYGKRLDAILEQRHRDLFLAWLGLDLATQATQVEQYITVDGENQYSLNERWIQQRLYEKLIPPAAREVERKLFVSNLVTILLLLQGRLRSLGESRP